MTGEPPQSAAAAILPIKITIENVKRYGAGDHTFTLAPLTLILGANGAGKSTFFQMIRALQQSWPTGEPAELLQLHTEGPLVSLGRFVSVIHGQDARRRMRIRMDDGMRRPLELVYGGEDGDLSGRLERASLGDGPWQLDFSVEALPGQTGIALVPAVPSLVRQAREQQGLDWSTLASTEEGRFSAGFRLVVEQVATGGTVTRVEIDERLRAAATSVASDPALRSRRGSEELTADHRALLADADLYAALERVLASVEPMGVRRTLEVAVTTLVVDWPERIREGFDYLGPIRNVGARIHPLSLTGSSEIGAAGENLPVALFREPALLAAVNEKLAQLDIEYELTLGTPHPSIVPVAELKLTRLSADGHALTIGIPDTGCGVQQILPVLAAASMVELRNAKAPRSRPVLLLEQPELHLHPRMQVRLATVLAGLPGDLADAKQLDLPELRRSQLDRPFIIAETHSEHMVLRLQRLVGEKLVPAGFVSLLAVEPDPTDASRSCVTQIPLGEDGRFLRRWPQGFFDERTDEVLG